MKKILIGTSLIISIVLFGLIAISPYFFGKKIENLIDVEAANALKANSSVDLISTRVERGYLKSTAELKLMVIDKKGTLPLSVLLSYSHGPKLESIINYLKSGHPEDLKLIDFNGSILFDLSSLRDINIVGRPQVDFNFAYLASEQYKTTFSIERLGKNSIHTGDMGISNLNFELLADIELNSFQDLYDQTKINLNSLFFSIDNINFTTGAKKGDIKKLKMKYQARRRDYALGMSIKVGIDEIKTAKEALGPVRFSLKLGDFNIESINEFILYAQSLKDASQEELKQKLVSKLMSVIPKLIVNKLELGISKLHVSTQDGDSHISGKAWVPIEKGSMITMFTFMGFKSKFKFKLPISHGDKLLNDQFENYRRNIDANSDRSLLVKSGLVYPLIIKKLIEDKYFNINDIAYSSIIDYSLAGMKLNGKPISAQTFLQELIEESKDILEVDSNNEKSKIDNNDNFAIESKDVHFKWQRDFEYLSGDWLLLGKEKIKVLFSQSNGDATVNISNIGIKSKKNITKPILIEKGNIKISLDDGNSLVLKPVNSVLFKYVYNGNDLGYLMKIVN